MILYQFKWHHHLSPIKATIFQSRSIIFLLVSFYKQFVQICEVVSNKRPHKHPPNSADLTSDTTGRRRQLFP